MSTMSAVSFLINIKGLECHSQSSERERNRTEGEYYEFIIFHILYLSFIGFKKGYQRRL